MKTLSFRAINETHSTNTLAIQTESKTKTKTNYHVCAYIMLFTFEWCVYAICVCLTTVTAIR